MKPGKSVYGLLVACLIQTAVLAGEYLGAVAPHWSGNTIKLKAAPVDPRSLFRGDYARLKYDISTLPSNLYRGEHALRENERVYVRLEQEEQGISTANQIVLRQPEQGSFIRGRIKYGDPWKEKTELTLKYGIEAYFAPRREILALEKNPSAVVIAEVSLAGNGRAALKSLAID